MWLQREKCLIGQSAPAATTMRGSDSIPTNLKLLHNFELRHPWARCSPPRLQKCMASSLAGKILIDLQVRSIWPPHQGLLLSVVTIIPPNVALPSTVSKMGQRWNQKKHFPQMFLTNSQFPSSQRAPAGIPPLKCLFSPTRIVIRSIVSREASFEIRGIWSLTS